MTMSARYHFPSGGLEIDGAAVGDILVAVTSSDGRVVFVPTSGGAVTGSPVTASDGMGGFVIVFAEDGSVVYA